MTNPLILHTNKVESASSITVTSEATGFEKEKAYDHRTATYWKASAAGTVYYTVDMGSAVDVTAWACYAQDLFNNSGAIKLQYSSDNFAADVNDFGEFNLLTYSEQFDHANWASTGTPVITANTDIAPDGTLTADTIEDDDAVTNQERIFQTGSTSINSAQNYTASIYVKKDSTPRTTRFVGLRIKYDGSTAEYNYLYFDTSTGEYSLSVDDSNATAEIITDGDYWRIAITATSQDAANTTALLYFAPAGGASASWAVSDTATGSAVIWGAQLEQADSASEYSKTEAIASSTVPDDNTPIMRTGTSVSARYWRWLVSSTGSASNIGLLWLGEYLETNQGLSVGFEPLTAAQRFHPVDSVSQDGEFVGRTIKERPIKGSLNFVPVQTAAYIRGDYTTMLRAIEQHPFFVMPLPDSYPSEVYFCWTDNTIPKPRYTSSMYMGADIPIIAKVS